MFQSALANFEKQNWISAPAVSLPTKSGRATPASPSASEFFKKFAKSLQKFAKVFLRMIARKWPKADTLH